MGKLIKTEMRTQRRFRCNKGQRRLRMVRVGEGI
nr:MAG TPA: hypothetical protein [Caudoviricetes sp.]